MLHVRRGFACWIKFAQRFCLIFIQYLKCWHEQNLIRYSLFSLLSSSLLLLLSGAFLWMRVWRSKKLHHRTPFGLGNPKKKTGHFDFTQKSGQLITSRVATADWCNRVVLNSGTIVSRLFGHRKIAFGSTSEPAM